MLFADAAASEVHLVSQRVRAHEGAGVRRFGDSPDVGEVQIEPFDEGGEHREFEEGNDLQNGAEDAVPYDDFVQVLAVQKAQSLGVDELVADGAESVERVC